MSSYENKKKRDSKPLPKYLKPAGIGRRSGAFLIDLVLAFVLYFVCYYTIGVSVIAPNMGYNETVSEYNAILEDSGLIYYNPTDSSDSSNYSQHEFSAQSQTTYLVLNGEPTQVTATYGYELYEDVVWNYYTYFLLKEGFNLDPSVTTYEGAARYVLETVYGLTEENNYERIVTTSSDVNYGYTLATDENGEYDYTVQPVLNEATLEVYTNNPDTMATLAPTFLDFYFDSGADGELFQDCVTNFVTEVDSFVSASDRINTIAYVIRIPGTIFAGLFTFFILPMCVPHGRTLGKLATGLEVVDADGYKAKKWRLAIRYGILTAIWMLLFINSMMLAVVLMLLVYVIDAMFLMKAEKPQAIHDILAGTVVIEIKESTVFESAEDKAAFVAENPESDVALDDSQEPIGPEKDYSADILDLNLIQREREALDVQTEDAEFNEKAWDMYASSERKQAPKEAPKDEEPAPKEETPRPISSEDDYTDAFTRDK